MNLIDATQRTLHTMHIPAGARLLVGVSGGVDSMVLLDVLKQGHCTVTAAHVNFHLRGEESDADAQHVKQWCASQAIPLLVLDVDTKTFAAQHHLSTQVAARQLRYAWWNKLIEQGEFDYVATAHHQDDHIETILINLLRGTGLKGLTGIPMQRDHIIRPFLEVTRVEIEAYADANQIPFRVDSSNEGDHYLRNRIRHHVIPLLQQLVPGFQNRMKHTAQRTALEWKSWERNYKEWQENSIIKADNGYALHLQDGNDAFLLRWLEESGIPWSLAHDYVASAKSGGSVLHYNDMTLSRTGDGYFLKQHNSPHLAIQIDEPGVYFGRNYSLSMAAVPASDFEASPSGYIEFITPDVVTFPLTLRPVVAGDSFQPLGMHGQSKKLQDLLVDRKVSAHEKEEVLVLANADHIIWVVGYQLDERAKVNTQAGMLYKLTFEHI